MVHESITDERVAWRGAHALAQRWKQWYGLWELGAQASAKEMARAAWHTEQMRRRDVILIPATWCTRHAQDEIESMETSDGEDGGDDEDEGDDEVDEMNGGEEHQHDCEEVERPTAREGGRRDSVGGGSGSELGGETRRRKQAITAAVQEARQAQAIEEDDGRGCFDDLPTRQQNARWRVTAAEMRLIHHLQAGSPGSDIQHPAEEGQRGEESAEHAGEQHGYEEELGAHPEADESEAYEQHEQGEQGLKDARGERQPERDGEREVNALQDDGEEHDLEGDNGAAEAAAVEEQPTATHEQQQEAQQQPQAQQQQLAGGREETTGGATQDSRQEHGGSQQQLVTSTRTGTEGGGVESMAEPREQGQHEEARDVTCMRNSNPAQEERAPNKEISASSQHNPTPFPTQPRTFRTHAIELFSAVRGKAEGALVSTAEAIRQSWAWARGIRRPPLGGGGDSVAAPAPRWGEGGASAGTPLPGDRPMVVPEDTTAEALPSKRDMNK